MESRHPRPMMKALLVALMLALTLSDTLSFELSGDWYTSSIIADDVDKVVEGGPLRLYIRHFQCLNNCTELAVTFYIHSNGDCQKNIIIAKHVHDGVYRMAYEGDNHFKVFWRSDKFMALSSTNTDHKGKVTKLIFIVGKGIPISEEGKRKLENYVEANGFSRETIQYIPHPDVCPE